MQDLTKILRKEIPTQCIDNDKIHISIPVLPEIIASGKELDSSSVEEIFNSLKPEYDRDMELYMSFLYNDEVEKLGLKNYTKFRKEWSLSYGASKDTKLPHFIFNINRKRLEMACIGGAVPYVVFGNYKNEFGELRTPEETAVEPKLIDICIWYRPRFAVNLAIFSKEKMDRFKPKDTLYKIDNAESTEFAGHGLCSSHLDNVAEGLIIRNFGVKYLNTLAEKSI